MRIRPTMRQLRFTSSRLNHLTFADSEFNNKRRKTRKEIKKKGIVVEVRKWKSGSKPFVMKYLYLQQV